jgi:bifunctional oligoribonuclease and PAP phosphatase NrnA
MSKQYFLKEFNTLNYILQSSSNILIIGHSNPDADAVGSTVALRGFIKKHYSANVSLGCYDDFPKSLMTLIPDAFFIHPEDLDIKSFDVIIGCDSVDRGFNSVIKDASDSCVTVIIDHHHDTITRADLFMNDANYSSTCEILYNFFKFTHKAITKDLATALLAGIIFDTGAFQHSNTTAETLSAASNLVKGGASITKINKALFSNRNVETLNLWGRALERTKFHKETGLAVAAITTADLNGYLINSGEISNIASMLTTVPDVRAAIIVYQSDPNTIKGSLRAEKHGGIDVSAIAHTLGGGGHKLASGFSIPGKIKTLPNGNWQIV